jgi:hypothetical protein
MDISFVYPSSATESEAEELNGIFNIESIRFEDKEGNFISVSFEMGAKEEPYIQFVKKGNIIPNRLNTLKDVFKLEDLEELEKNFLEELKRNAAMSHQYFNGKPTDWDEDLGPEIYDVNIGFIENGCFGKFIKINVTGKRKGHELIPTEQEQVVKETIKILKTII